METILAGYAEFDNDIRAARAKLGMAHRLREGICPWKPPLGYLAPKIGKKTRPDIPDPRRFEYIKKAWKLFASGAYSKMAIVRMLREWDVRSYRGGKITPQAVDNILTNQFYAGVVQDPWTRTEYRGAHKAMVTPAEFARVQTIISRRSKAVRHNRFHPAFPLRGHVRCPVCRFPLAGGLTTGRTARYAYYDCRNPDCSIRRKSYPAAAVHREFSQFLSAKSVPGHVVKATLTDAIAAWRDRQITGQDNVNRKKKQVEGLQRQIKELVSMRSAELIDDDEFTVQRDALRDELRELQSEQFENGVKPLTVEEQQDLEGWLTDLEGLWASLPIERQHWFADLVFRDGYVFQNMRTAQPALLFKTFGASEGRISNLVRLSAETANQLFLEIRGFLSVVKGVPAEKEKAA